jgi:rhodanese-related sulfurtransferase
MIPEITCTALNDALKSNENFIIVDVREEHETVISKIEGSIHIPLGDIEDRLAELDKSKALIMQCRSGGRSATATQILLENGFKDVRNLVGGINEWASTIDTSMATY